MGAADMADRLTTQIGFHKSAATKAASSVLSAFAEVPGYGPEAPMSEFRAAVNGNPVDRVGRQSTERQMICVAEPRHHCRP